MSDLGEIESILVFTSPTIIPNRCLQIDQAGYTRDVIDHFGMADANPNKTPLPAGADVLLVKYDGEASSLMLSTTKASLAASSMYRLAHTQIFLLLCCALHNIQQNPSPQHLRLAQYILSYY